MPAQELTMVNNSEEKNWQSRQRGMRRTFRTKRRSPLQKEEPEDAGSYGREGLGADYLGTGSSPTGEARQVL